MDTYFIGILVLFLGGIISLFFKNQTNKLKFVSICAVLGAILTTYSTVCAFIHGGAVQTFKLGSVFQNVTFSLDYLSAFFALVISIMTPLGIIYSNGYLKHYIDNKKDISAHCVFLLMLFASMLGVITVQNSLMFLIIWELMSLSSFFLVIFEHEKKDVLEAGIKYLVYMHISVIFIILLFVFLSTSAGSLDFNTYQKVLTENNGYANLIFILSFIGFGIKAGFVPFHNWLPSAHPAAPSHVSGVMSGVMIKTGIYGILRTLSFIAEPSVQISYFVLIIGVITAIYGVLYASAQSDLKKMLAYSSIENIGIMGIGIGVGMLGLAYQNPVVATLGFAGGMLHILNHSIFKELLFLGAGAVYSKTHTRDMETLGGLIKSMPKTGFLFLIGCIAICGLPPFNGFISEFLIYFGMLKGITIGNFSSFIGFFFGLGGLALVGTLAILCFTKTMSITFLGEKRTEFATKVKDDVTISFIIPMSILAVFTLIIGLIPNQIFKFMTLPTSTFIKLEDIGNILNIMQTISIVCASLIGLIILLFIIKQLIFNKHEKYSTWGCGYDRGSAKVQYSGASYVSPLMTTLTPLFVKRSDVKKPKTMFPKEAHYETHVEDIEEVYFLKPLLKSTEKFLEQFERVQNGNIQYYIACGIFFLLISLIGVVILG